jgi:hypothetical protein
MYNYTDEGVGAQYQRILCILLLCHLYNIKYIHQKITIGHNYDNDINWNEKWDNLFNLYKLSSEITDNKEKLLIERFCPSIEELTHNINNLKKDNNKNYIIKITNSTIIGDHFINYFNDILPNIRNLYEYNGNYIYNKNYTNIAIHIRVHNKCDTEHPDSTKEYGNRYTLNCNDYNNLIIKLKKKYKNPLIHIFTQESYEFDNLEDVIFYKDIDAFFTLHHLIKADVLVIAKSSFSYLAALYNENEVIYVNFWHKPLPYWNNYDNFLVKL